MESIDSLPFETAMAELESVVEKLEDGTLDLQQTVLLYQRGRALAARCQSLLDATELHIQQLVPNDTGGHTAVSFEDKVL